MSILKNVVALLGCLIVSVTTATAAEVNVISDRSDFHVRPILEAFEEATGIDVNVVFVDKGSLPARLASGADKNADILIATDLPTLAIAKEEGYTQPIGSKGVAKLGKGLADPEGHYAALSFRARTIVYNKDKVDPTTLNGYEDLANPKFKGRVCSRPLTHTYNVTMLSEMIAEKGEAYARKWVEGLVNNLAVKPSGNDRKQGTLVSEGVCDIALMNTYYYGLLLSNNAQRPVANATQLFFPEQNGKGSYVLYSGVAMAKTAQNVDAARQLIDFMLGTVGQNFFSQVNFEYPVDSKVAYSVITQGFGEGQPGIEKGNAKFNHIDAEAVAANRGLAVKILTEASK